MRACTGGSLQASLVAQTVKRLPTMWVDPGSIPGSGRSSAEGNGNPLQYSHLENLMDRGVWQATVHGITRVRHDLQLNYYQFCGSHIDQLFIFLVELLKFCAYVYVKYLHVGKNLSENMLG